MKGWKRMTNCRLILEHAKPNARYGEDVDNKSNSACQYRAVPLAIEK